MANIYCVDSSSLILLARTLPRSVLGSLWDLVEKLAAEGRLIAPLEVERELSKRDDLAFTWAKDHKSVFLDPDAKQGAMVGSLQVTYPCLNDPAKPIHADPWLLAITFIRTAAGESSVLITEEKDTTEASCKLPYLCRDLKLQSGRLLDVPGLEGLRFTLSTIPDR